MRNPNYHGARPRRPGRIVYITGTSPQKGVVLINRGGAEYLPYDFDPESPLLARRRDRAHLRQRQAIGATTRRPGTGLDLVAFNTRHGPFKACACAARPRPRSTAPALAGVYPELPSSRLVPDGVLPGRGPLPDPTGSARGRGRVAVLYSCGDPGGGRIGEIVRANLRRIGIRVRVEPSLDCLRGPDPKRERADISLVTLAQLRPRSVPVPRGGHGR